MAQIVAVLLGLVGGVVAWFGANFYGRSLVLFFELRALAHEEMMFSADLTSMLDPVQYNASAERLRRLASRLKSLAETTPRAVRRLWLASGYNPGAAAGRLRSSWRAIGTSRTSSACMRTLQCAKPISCNSSRSPRGSPRCYRPLENRERAGVSITSVPIQPGAAKSDTQVISAYQI